MRASIRTALCAAFATAATTTSAAAAVRTLTFNGTFANVFDTAGEFGMPNTDLTGLSYSATIVYQSANPLRGRVPGAFDNLVWEPGSPGPKPIIDATMTVGGDTIHFHGDFLDILISQVGQLEFRVEGFNFGSSPQDSSDLSFNVQVPVADANLDQTFPTSPAISSDSHFNVVHQDDANSPQISLVGGVLNVDSASLSGAVPEPAAWALMILGLGAVGERLRRRLKPIATT
ncbi:MAG: PEP-CTERM sorting domain-containing protein [Proteobacteria bacterium]|nr:PEP-CTERM sorting domain-containing protein [Pseudomonadota bacterium]